MSRILKTLSPARTSPKVKDDWNLEKWCAKFQQKDPFNVVQPFLLEVNQKIVNETDQFSANEIERTGTTYLLGIHYNPSSTSVWMGNQECSESQMGSPWALQHLVCPQMMHWCNSSQKGQQLASVMGRNCHWQFEGGTLTKSKRVLKYLP